MHPHKKRTCHILLNNIWKKVNPNFSEKEAVATERRPRSAMVACSIWLVNNVHKVDVADAFVCLLAVAVTEKRRRSIRWPTREK